MVMLMNTGGVASTNCFLIADEATNQAVLFDAPDHTTEPLLREVIARGWNLAGLWLTHGHFDHFADHSHVKKRFPSLPVLLHSLDAPKARHPELQTRLFGLSFEISPLEPDAAVADNQELKLGGLKVQVLHTPGHSPGHVAYYLPQAELLIGGDLIIAGSVGRTDLPDSDHAQLESSIRRVMSLPAGTKLLGGHGPVSTLERERRYNPFVQEALENARAD
jgi:glyoxylase-like metal-dependent hydrolase (beta-lactamase superfamily II)